jgi:uncharacterized protein with HEPN domain
LSRAGILRLEDDLEHIAGAIERIHAYVDGMDEVAFLQDAKTQDAVIRNFEIVGEAARNVLRAHQEYADEHPEIPWQLMITLRNRVAHGYFAVDFELIWRTIHADLPSLHRDVRALVDELASGKIKPPSDPRPTW